MEPIPLTVTHAQTTPGEIYETQFVPMNTIHRVTIKELKISGVGITPHSIEIHFEDNNNRGITSKELNFRNIHVSLGTQTGTDWIEENIANLPLWWSKEATRLDHVRFRVLNGDDRTNLTFTRISIKFELMTYGGEQGASKPTSQRIQFPGQLSTQ